VFDAAVIIFTSSIYPINPSSVPHPPIETAACFVATTHVISFQNLYNALASIIISREIIDNI
jgi:hypothetical protein